MTEEQAKLFDNVFLATVLDRMHSNIYITDIETDEILYMNQAMKQTFGLTHPEGNICWQILQKGMDRRCSFCRIDILKQEHGAGPCMWREINTVTGRVYQNYDSLIKWDGKTYHFQESIDVTEFEQISNSARTDELTQMPNRRGGHERLARTMEMAQRENQIVTLVLYDINELKQVNDTYGHSAGDDLIRYVSSITGECLGRMDFMFRLSGDEFVMVFYGRSISEADESMKRVLARAGKDRERSGNGFGVPFSYGLTEIYPGEGSSIDDVIARADEQMYIQKRAYHITRAKKELARDGQGGQAAGFFGFDNESFYSALTASTDDYIFVGNMKTGVFRYPQAMVDEFGLPGQVVRNAAAFWGGLIHPHDEAYFLESNQNIADGREDHHNIEYRARNVKGEWIWLRCRGRMNRDENGRPELFAGMITNLGKRNMIDHMTGLYNKYEFEGDVKKYLVDRKAADIIGVMVLNLDSFKNINDLYDRSFGDEVLRLTAQKVSSMLPANAKLYRLDGDEFGILCLGGGQKEAWSIFHRIQQNFHKQQEYNGRKYYCTFSAGYAAYPKDGDSYLELLKYANYSLEYSKIAGRNRMTVFSMDILYKRERRLELVELLREGIERGFAGFSICYQAQVDALTGSLKGAEALARWHCSKYGDISPGEFIPLLEQNGLIVLLGQWIFTNAARQCREWLCCLPDFRMSINLSYVQLAEGGIIPYMEETLKELGLPASHIIMELTETYLAKADQSTLKLLEEMKSIGIRVAIDDFGVGYSSLFSLKNIPVDIVKIDRSFVKGVTADLFNSTFIRSITELCHDVGKEVCLEGVESEEEYRVVRALGMEYIQGFYFGRPVSPGLFEQGLRQGPDTL